MYAAVIPSDKMKAVSGGRTVITMSTVVNAPLKCQFYPLSNPVPDSNFIIGYI